MYTNLLLFLVAIFVFSIGGVPEHPLLPEWQALGLQVLLFFLYDRIAVRLYARPGAVRTAGYFRTEKQLSILALAFFGATIYLCDPKFYLSYLSFGNVLPSLVNFAGLALFVAYLALMWRAGRKNYERIFAKPQGTFSFIRQNLRTNLPIVLPWIVLSLLYDIVTMLPFPGLQRVVAAQWGDLIFFVVFLLFVMLFFPPLVRRLWNCRKLPDGPLKSHLDEFCRSRNFTADFYIWPLFEGRMMTAAVMGILPGLRYILLTPALMETMSVEELEAVIAHEIGHVKKYHLLLYICLIAGFSLLAGLLAEPMVYLILSLGFVNRLLLVSGPSVEGMMTVVVTMPLLIFMVVYFRFIFGYFIRNFERQADLFSLATTGSSRALVSAFEKIAIMSGSPREERNWHHFGIGERIDCLQQAEREPRLIGRHNHKVRFSLVTYISIILLAVVLVRQIPTEQLAEQYQANFTEAALQEKARHEPNRAIWQRLMGDLMLTRKMEGKALAAYEKALDLEPTNPEIMNNIAWLMLTSEDLALRDPQRALTLARTAAALQPKGHIIDTLATAYWANGLVQEAVRVESKAVALDVSQRRYYQGQITRFLSQSYEDSLREQAAARGNSPEAKVN